MSQETNLPLTNPQDNFDQRVQDYFVNYFDNPIELTDSEYSAAKSFFLERTNNNEQAAAALTASVIQAANELGMYIVDVIEDFKYANDLKSAVPTFLNLSRRGSSLLGYEAGIEPTENTQRQTVA